MKKILMILLAVISIAASSQTTYYVDETDGSDVANGLTPSTAFKNISHVNGLTLVAGDSVLFQAGEVWRETLILSYNGTAGEGNFIVFSRYGEGVNPRIIGSEEAITWTETATSNVWQSATTLTNLSYYDQATGGWDGYQGRIFFIEQNDSISWGHHNLTSYQSLASEHDYFVTGVSNDINQTYYIYSESDPNTQYKSIEVTQRSVCVQSSGTIGNYTEFNGIDLLFSRTEGYDLGYPAERGATDQIFRNMRIGYIGSQPSGKAYGLSVAASNMLIENCVIGDCGRRGISINLYREPQSTAEERVLKNIIIRNNVFKRGYHTTGLDLSTQQTTRDSIYNLYFYNNFNDDSDFNGDICQGCLSNQLYTQAGGSYIDSIYIFSNTFVGANARNILFEDGSNMFVWNNSILGHDTLSTLDAWWTLGSTRTLTVDYVNNLYYDPTSPTRLAQNYGIGNEFAPTTFPTRDYNLYYQENPLNGNDFTGGTSGYYNTTAWASFLSDNPTWDQNSPTPADPEFVDWWNEDFNIEITSPAYHAGTDMPSIMLTDPYGNTSDMTAYDINGELYDSPPSIGAYEYAIADPTATDITSFVLSEQSGVATINSTAHTVDIETVYGTSLTSLTPTIGVSRTATISPLSGTAQDFSSPLDYTVTGGDAVTEQVWEVTVTVAEASTETDILTFTIPNQMTSSVNSGNHTVTIQMPYGTDASSLTPTITLSSGATIDPLSGVAQDFTNTFNYTVTAEDEVTEQEWDIIVIVTTQPTVLFWIFNDGSIGVFDNGEKAVEYE